MLFTKQTQNSCNWRSQVVSISKLISQACSLELMHKGLFTQWKWRLWQPRCTGTLGSNGTWYLGHCPTAGTAEVWLEGLRGSAAPEGQVPPGLQVTYLLILFNFFFIWLDFLSLISKLFSEYSKVLTLCPRTSENMLTMVMLLKLCSCMQPPF